MTNEAMKERTKQYVVRRKQNTRIQYIIVMMSFFIMLSVTLSLTQVADATNILASCGYVEHTHTPDCYYRKLTCTNTDPGHTHDLDCFDYVLICGQHAHTHNATCFETKDTGHFVTLLSLFSPVNQTQSDEVVVSMAPKPEQEIIEMPETELVHRVPTVIKEQEEQKKNQETAAVPENNVIPEQQAAGTNAEAGNEETASLPAPAEVQATEKPVTVPTEQPVSVPAAKPETHTENYSIHPAEETIVLQPVDLNTPEPEIHDPVEYTELTESIEEEYPAVISYLNISPAVVQPGQSVTFDFRAENAEAYFYRIYSNDEEYESGSLSADAMSFVWNPEISGEYTFALTAYNSSGSIDSETVKGVVYTEEKKEEWLNTIKAIALTGNWTEDLVTVASSQNGFLASDIASMVDVDPAFRSRSDSVDSRFIAFCMNYAGINNHIISDYTKEDGEIHKGDVLFFDYQRDGIIDHMAIVTECSEGIVYVIEVGQNGLVKDEWYSIYDEAITGHFDTAAAQIDYGTYPLTYDGGDFTVTADAYHVSGIMEDAFIQVIEKDEAYEKEEPDKKILSSRAYEIVFISQDGELITPLKDIHFTVEYRGEEQVLLDGRAGSTRKKNTLEFTGREDLTFFEAWYERLLKLEAVKGNVKVTFTYSEKTELPLNTRLEIREITEEAEYSQYLEQANEAFDTVSKASFYEIGIYEGDAKADPEGTLQVEVNTEHKEDNSAVYAMHYVDEAVVEIADVEKEKSIISFENTKKEETVQTENSLRKNSMYESTGSSNVVGIIETVMETKVITSDGETYSIEVAYGPEAQLPVNAQLSAYEIKEDDERYAAFIERMRTKRTEEETETSFRLFDIAILDEYGNEIEPGKPVRVNIRLTDIDAVKENVQAYHFTGVETTDELSAEAEGNAISFSADSFSVYGIAYTVDFSYSVDGQMYEFSLPGGGFVSLEHLVEILGIHTGTAADVKAAETISESITLKNVTVSDAAKEFVANVRSVAFSNPELVDVSRADYETTVGQIKESRGLDVQYSSELTEEQILEINSSTVEAGDWVLISKLPFSTFETLTVTMNDDTVYTIEVTDAQISTHVITADGKDFTITVTYGPEAEIPDGAKLEADEIAGDTDEYQYYLTKAMEAMNEKHPENESTDAEYENSMYKVDSAWARFFDIRIMADGQKIEPAAPVTVTISYEEALRVADGEEILAVHFGEYGVELIEADTDQSNKKVVFKQDGFSVTGTIVTSNGNWPNSNGEYVIYVQSDGKYYAVAHDGSLHEVTANGNQLIFPDDALTFDVREYLWNYEGYQSWSMGGTRWNRFIYYLDPYGVDHYIDPSNASGISVDTANISHSNDGKIYIGNNYIGVQDGSIVGLTDQENGVPLQFANNFPVSRLVTIHFVDRYGNLLTGVTYDGPSDYPVIAKSDGTFAIPYAWDGMNGTLMLNEHFSKEGYTYASTHLAGIRQQTTLTYDGLAIDAKLTERGDALYFYSDTGSQSGLAYSALTERNLNNSLVVTNTAGNGTTNYLNGNVDKDIYVILDPVPTSIPGVHSSDLSVYDPEFNKTLEYNDDGTYTLSLSAKGHGINTSGDLKANVLFIVDTSSSMDKTDGTGTGYSRLHDTKPALKNIAENLLSVNSLSGKDNDTVELAMISFDGGVVDELGWTTSQTAFNNAVDNGLIMHRGTDWEDALKRAYEIGLAKQQAEPEQQVFVVFFTDGEGSQYSNFHGQGSYNNGPGTYSRYFSYFLCRESAKDEARAIVNAGMLFYAVYAFNPDTNNYNGESGSDMLHNLIKYGYNSTNVIDNHFFARANSTRELEDALDAILQQIREFLGCSDVVMNDDITSLTSTGINLVSGAVGGFTYTRSGGRFGDGQPWANAPVAIHTENEDGNVTSVQWDLGSTVLEDGITYTLSFKVWPNQEAYDWLANLENGTKTWEDVVAAGLDAPNGANPQIVKNGNSYSLLTNKPSLNSDEEIINNEITYTKTHTEIVSSLPAGVVVGTEYEGTDEDGNRTITTYTQENDLYIKTVVVEKTTYFPNPDPMPLQKESMNVIKQWETSMNTSHPADELKFRVLVDGKYYQNDGTLVAGEAGLANAKELTVSDDTFWTNSINIAPGIVKYYDDDGNPLEEALVLETGHKYTLEEFDLMENGSAFLYYTSYEFHSQTMRPMIVDGTLKYLVLIDDANPAPQNAETCRIGNETYYVAASGSGQGALSGTNYRTAELDITKIINNQSGVELSDEELSAESFTYRVTLRIPDGTDPAGIVGYEYIPRTQSNAYTLFGYQAGETAFESDIVRFNGKTFRAWNTLVYRDLVEWENVGGRIIAKTDEDGNILWKIPKDDDGYHTITYDMTLNINEVIRFTNIPTGTLYSIQEIYANYYKADNAADSAGHAPIAKVSNIEEEGYEISQVLTTNGNLSATDVEKDTVSGTIETPNVRYYNQFTNDLKAARAQVTVLKTTQNGTTPLPGAVFSLYSKSGYEADPKEPMMTDLTSSDEAGKEGTIDLGKLKEGIYYLVETHAPDGYYPLKDPVVITVSHDAVTYEQENSSLDDSGIGIIGNMQEGYQLTVINNDGYELPSAGGSGTLMYRVIGLLTVGLAAALLVKKRN